MTGTAIVVGAGIGGLTAAHALRRKGWQVDIYEQAPELAPVGSGLGIYPNAVKALRHLGLGGQLREYGLLQGALEIRNPSGRRLLSVPVEDLERRFGAPFYIFHRAALHEMFLDQLRDITLSTGHEATALTQHTDSASVTFSTPDGTKAVTADLVVAADGIRSHLRSAVFPDYPGPSSAGYRIWRAVVPAEVAPAVPSAMSVTTGDGGARFGTSQVRDGRAYWFACENVTGDDRPDDALGTLAARFRRYHDPIPQLIAATPQEVLRCNDVSYLRAPLPGFVHGRVVLLGDAAHATTPDVGQGACLAIEDAAVLADVIEEQGIEDGLRSYDAARRPRAGAIARFSGRLSGIMQVPSPALGRVRDTLTRATPTPLFLRAVSTAYGWTPATR